MRPRLTVSRSAVELIKAFEGFRAKAARLDDGRWTIGYGHTQTAREGAEVAERDAEALLLYDLIPIAHAVNEAVYAPLNQNQFDALVSFVFNIGTENFRRSITYRRLNEGRPLEAALSMILWRKSDLEGERIIVDALVRRRATELALFLRPLEGFAAAPTPVLPPAFDYDAIAGMPLQKPVAARAAMAGERAFAERAAERPFEPPEQPSASRAAAEAVINRLEAILSDPGDPPAAKPEAAQEASEAAPSAASPAPPSEATAEPAVVLSIMPARKRRRAHPIWLLALGLLGVGLFLLAALWGFEPAGAKTLGVSGQSAGLVVGAAGVVCFSMAVYFLLERLGLPSERKT